MSSMTTSYRIGHERTRVQHTSFVETGHTEKVDPLLKQECTKIIYELNQETAHYCTLVVCIGASNDSDCLRDELKRSRTRAHDLANRNKVKLIPLLKNKLLGNEDIRELERLHNIFSACLELLELQLKKTAHLQRAFPLHSGTTVLINAGYSEWLLTSKHTASSEHLEPTRTDRSTLEKEDFRCLEKEINDLREMVFDINQTIPVQPWAIEADVDTIKYTSECNKSIASSSSSLDITTVTSGDPRRRRCACIVIFTVTAIVISASIVGASIGVLR